jgi:hypothetical protein
MNVDGPELDGQDRWSDNLAWIAAELGASLQQVVNAFHDLWTACVQAGLDAAPVAEIRRQTVRKYEEPIRALADLAVAPRAERVTMASAVATLLHNLSRRRSMNGRGRPGEGSSSVDPTWQGLEDALQTLNDRCREAADFIDENTGANARNSMSVPRAGTASDGTPSLARGAA